MTIKYRMDYFKSHKPKKCLLVVRTHIVRCVRWFASTIPCRFGVMERIAAWFTLILIDHKCILNFMMQIARWLTWFSYTIQRLLEFMTYIASCFTLILIDHTMSFWFHDVGWFISIFIYHTMSFVFHENITQDGLRCFSTPYNASWLSRRISQDGLFWFS